MIEHAQEPSRAVNFTGLTFEMMESSSLKVTGTLSLNGQSFVVDDEIEPQPNLIVFASADGRLVSGGGEAHVAWWDGEDWNVVRHG